MIERHPLTPFLPENARVLFLGSFPPQRKRWCMEFYYPNFINDHWRLEGEVFFGDRNHFVCAEAKTFNVEAIKAFCQTKGLAFYDTACAVRRLKDNASDQFLEVVEATDIRALLRHLPHCRAIATTGQKATDTLCRYFSIPEPPRWAPRSPSPTSSTPTATSSFSTVCPPPPALIPCRSPRKQKPIAQCFRRCRYLMEQAQTLYR